MSDEPSLPTESIPVEVLAPDPRRGLTSASSAEADHLCPGRHLAQKNFPDRRGGEWAEYGSRIHEAVADISVLLSLSSDQVDMAESLIAIEGKLRAKFEEQHGPITKIVREKRLWLYSVEKNERLHSGQPDVIFIADTKGYTALLIHDYKTLPGDVAASPGNMQLRDLAVMASLAYEADVVHASVIQPLVTHSPIVTVYNPDDLKRSERTMRKRISASNNPAAPRMAGWKQCRWCRAWEKCPEAQVAAQGIVQQRNATLEPITREQRIELYEFCKLVASKAEAFAHNIETEVKANPTAWPEFTVKEQHGKRTIEEPLKVAHAVATYLTPSQFIEAASMPITHLETAYAAAYRARNGGTIKDAKADLEKRITGLVTRGKGSVKLTFNRKALGASPTTPAIEDINPTQEDTHGS